MPTVPKATNLGQRPVGDAAHRYAAFLSYAHVNSAVAADVQRQVQRLAKPWYRLRSLRVFRDDADLAAGPALWEPIEVALGESANLVFLASSAAARSEWVRREIAWWLSHRGADSIIIGVVDGSIVWDEALGYFGPRTDCLPPDLLRAFPLSRTGSISARSGPARRPAPPRCRRLPRSLPPSPAATRTRSSGRTFVSIGVPDGSRWKPWR